VGTISFDCDDVQKMATFWSAVLDRPIDKGASEGRASIGGADGSEPEPAWYCSKVPESKRAKNRVHLDLVNPDARAVEGLVALGATVVAEHTMPGGHRWTVLRDPKGNEFCVAAKAFTGWD
jgi:predicted enzyme related to lactoylglutathione lyase